MNIARTERVVRAFFAGQTTTQIAKSLGVKTHVVYKILYHRDVFNASPMTVAAFEAWLLRQAEKKARKGKIVEAYRKGATQDEIAKQFGITRWSVARVTRKAGLTRYDGGAIARDTLAVTIGPRLARSLVVVAKHRMEGDKI